MARSIFFFWAFIWEEMDFVDFGAQVNKYSYIREHKNIFFFALGV